MDAITIKLTDSGYYHARWIGPCEWAQWPKWETLSEEHFFPEASQHFRGALRDHLALHPLPEHPASGGEE